MKKKITLFSAVITAAAMFAGFGCDSEDNKTYDVTVKWTIADMPICESPNLDSLPDSLEDPSLAGTADNKLSVQNINVKVYEDITDPEELPLRDVSVPCSGSGNSYLISGLERGTYDVKLEGVATYDGVTLPYYQGTAEIVAPSEETTSVSLRIVGGSVKAMWQFETGMCGANGVEKVKLTLIGEEYGTTYTADNVACDDGFVLKEDVDWDIYYVEMEGYDGSNTMTHYGSSAESFKVRPGEEAEAAITLQTI